MTVPVVYAGSFDPVTNGHLDIIRRARAVFGEVVVLLMPNANKRCLFSREERLQLLKEVLQHEAGIRVDCAEGLLTDYLKKNHFKILVRGLRGPSDLDHELTNAHYNRLFYPSAETVFLPCRAEYAFLSASAVREAFAYGADIRGLVPECVAHALEKKRSAPR